MSVVTLTNTNTCAPPPTRYTWRDARVTSYGSFGSQPYKWRVYDEDGAHDFSADEYEMSVSFTRRPKPLAVGDVVKPKFGISGTIDAIANTRNKTEYWVRSNVDGSHMTYFGEQLERMSDFDNDD